MRVEIMLSFEFQTALHIGAAAASWNPLIDKVMTRNKSLDKGKDGFLIIPASSLKGKLRSECERILRGLGRKDICISPAPQTMCPNYDWQRGKPTERYCPICRIFGSPWKNSPLQFYDARWEDATLDKHGRADLRSGVALSRTRKVAEEAKLFFSETTHPNGGVVFAHGGKIEGELVEDKEIALVLVGLKSLFTLGGGKTRGLGWLQPDKPIYGTKILVDKQPRKPSEFIPKMKEWANV